ncbi:MAG: L-2-hydroxyglutarate oxidase [Verrucomicrobiota bacterium]
MDNTSQVIIVGGGIVGLASAYHIVQNYPDRWITILEKEHEVAHHQTGHNSGVLHSGIYYKPGSLKAQNCRRGIEMMKGFCEREGIPYDVCGKVIVATEQNELERLKSLHERGKANGVQCEIIGSERLKEIEPHCDGLMAIHIPEAGIVSYAQVCRRLQQLVEKAGNRVVTGAQVTDIQEDAEEVIVQSTRGEFRAKYLINCAGLHSDRVTALSGQAPSVKILPFRGEYYELAKHSEHLCRGLIYPVPDPQFPFLGVHLTRMIGGGVHCGPNAVLAFAREGYRKSDINLRDLGEALTYPGFLKLAVKHWRMGAAEMWRSLSKAAFVRALQRLVPEIKSEDLTPSPAGVRAQAVSPDGKMVDDFAIDEGKRIINVINAPSPAATASLSVGLTIAEKLGTRLDL